MTLTPEQIQVIRAATCEGCRMGLTMETEDIHRKPGSYQNQWKRVPCTAATDLIAVVEGWLVAACDQGLDVTDLQELKLTDAYKRRLLPSPCGIAGHWAVDWVEGAHAPHVGDTEHHCQSDCLPGHCRTCSEIAEKVQAARVSAAGAMRASIAGLLERSPTHEWPHMTRSDWVQSILEYTLATDDGSWLKAHDAKIRNDEAELQIAHANRRVEAEHDLLAQQLAVARDALDNESTHNVLLQNEVKQLKQQIAAARLYEAKWWYARYLTDSSGHDRIAELEAKLAAGTQSVICNYCGGIGPIHKDTCPSGEQEPK